MAIDNGRHFYVSVVDPNNPKRYGLLLGPYSSHAEALENVDRGRVLAFKADPWAWFYTYGTCSAADELKTRFGI